MLQSDNMITTVTLICDTLPGRNVINSRIKTWKLSHEIFLFSGAKHDWRAEKVYRDWCSQRQTRWCSKTCFHRHFVCEFFPSFSSFSWKRPSVGEGLTSPFCCLGKLTPQSPKSAAMSNLILKSFHFDFGHRAPPPQMWGSYHLTADVDWSQGVGGHHERAARWWRARPREAGAGHFLFPDAGAPHFLFPAVGGVTGKLSRLRLPKARDCTRQGARHKRCQWWHIPSWI